MVCVFLVFLFRFQDVKFRDVIYSIMNVVWEFVFGKVRKYIVRYKILDEEFKEVGWR